MMAFLTGVVRRLLKVRGRAQEHTAGLVHLEAGRAYRDGADELLVVESSIFMPVSLTKYPAGYKWLVRRGVERMFINVRDGAPLPNWMLLPALRC